MIGHPELDAEAILIQVADQVPAAIRTNVVVIGSIATAWAYRNLSGTHTVATKDIDLLLRPAVDAVVTAETLGEQLLKEGWQPQFLTDALPADSETLDHQLPALRLKPPRSEANWFLELLAAPPETQETRKHWRRIKTAAGEFGLPSFRYMPVAVHGATDTPIGLRVAQPASMALAHLLEHSVPDRTPISNLPGNPPRFTKDLGRAVSLWWLAGQQSVQAPGEWRRAWDETLSALYPDNVADMRAAARTGLENLKEYLRDAHAIALMGVLAPHGTTIDAWKRAYEGLLRQFDES